MFDGEEWLESERAQDFYIDTILDRFFDRADEDYVATRVLYWNGLMGNYIWLAQQTLEKYLKAALLFRRKKIRQSHDLSWHFKHLRKCHDIKIAHVLTLPCKSAALPQQVDDRGRVQPWPFNEETSQFISRLTKMGSARSRYNEVNLSLEGYDLTKFDMVCKAIRDVCLEFPIAEKQSIVVHREVQDTPDALKQYRFGNTRLENTAFDLLRKRNFAYWPDNVTGDRLANLCLRNHEAESKIYRQDRDYQAAQKYLQTRYLDSEAKHHKARA